MQGNLPDYIHKYASPAVFKLAGVMRREPTKAESVLWLLLRNRNIAKAKFRRQHPFENFILNFYCHEMKLVIEADGGIHNEASVKEYDNIRTRRLNECGIAVLRFTNEGMIGQSTSVLKRIEAWILEQRIKLLLAVSTAQ